MLAKVLNVGIVGVIAMLIAVNCFQVGTQSAVACPSVFCSEVLGQGIWPLDSPSQIPIRWTASYGWMGFRATLEFTGGAMDSYVESVNMYALATASAVCTGVIGENVQASGSDGTLLGTIPRRFCAKDGKGVGRSWNDNADAYGN